MNFLVSRVYDVHNKGECMLEGIEKTSENDFNLVNLFRKHLETMYN